MIDLDDRDWCTVGDAAKRMAITEAAVRDLVDRRALRATFMYGVLHVEPAIVNTMPTT
ncbi:hypothetical protein [Mycolicibacterium hippocampi]|uniref:DNA-binding protein n=1 Tax=Mycolicibacterium hippocampi TaxID=659824 RepID=A0A7I9ZQS4_9MYCO|nr:hypothetical protein [Mycolicibacterium hippocampi]GFH03381.1 hypothetical protein MHIP_38640 [Mycolicibacterium hippocampi]